MRPAMPRAQQKIILVRKEGFLCRQWADLAQQMVLRFPNWHWEEVRPSQIEETEKATKHSSFWWLWDTTAAQLFTEADHQSSGKGKWLCMEMLTPVVVFSSLLSQQDNISVYKIPYQLGKTAKRRKPPKLLQSRSFRGKQAFPGKYLRFWIENLLLKFCVE